MATITRRKRKKGYRYTAQIRLEGHPGESKTFDSRREAVEWARRREPELKYQLSDHGTSLIHTKTVSAASIQSISDITFGDFLDRFLEYLETDPSATKGKHKNYLKSHRFKVKWWKAKYGEMQLSEISHKLLKRTFDSVFYENLDDSNPNKIKIATRRRKKPREVSTFRKFYFTLSLAFQFGIDHEYVDSNPVALVTQSKAFKSYKPNQRNRILVEDELPRLMEACRQVDTEANPKLYAFNQLELVVMLWLLTGKRKQSILNLEWKDIDLKNRCLVVRDLKSERLSSTGNEERGAVKIVLSKDSLLFKKLRDYYFSKDRNPKYLFPSKDGKGTRDVRKPWLKALKLAGIKDFKPHDCRHDAATSIRNDGVGIADIQDFLGVKSIQMVLRYAHGNEERLNEIRLDHQESFEKRMRS